MNIAIIHIHFSLNLLIEIWLMWPPTFYNYIHYLDFGFKCSDSINLDRKLMISCNFWCKTTIWVCFCKIGWNWTENWTGFTHSNPLVQLCFSQNTLNFRKKLEKFWRRSEKIFLFFPSFKIQNVHKCWYDAVHGRPISVQFTVQFCPDVCNCNSNQNYNSNLMFVFYLTA